MDDRKNGCAGTVRRPVDRSGAYHLAAQRSGPLGRVRAWPCSP